MKKIFIALLLVGVSVQFSSCKSKNEKKDTNTVEKSAKFTLQKASNEVHWTAYKTTEKAPVNGEFKQVKITKNGGGNTIKEAINNAGFSIPITSIFTDNPPRDTKLRQFFFGMMDNTSLLSGTLVIDDETTGHASITMNDITKDLPFTYTIVDNTFELNAVMDLENWDAKKAIDALNKACNELHKGKDGISKTWNDVAIHIISVFK